MGRITIYSLKECPHCQRCKGALKERNIPYTEINLSAHPAARTNMLQLTDRLSVPQVFFNAPTSTASACQKQAVAAIMQTSACLNSQ
mmetsp:Transcript_2782/g.4496  ORF Transcript_2782/g.4496 Transcript_2782/m.4496 type:complete len:87 (-) Transcript_2782:1369-1629(-)